MANLGELTARVSLDKVDFSKNLAALKRELKTAKSDFDLAGKGVDAFGNEIDGGAKQLDLLKRQIDLNKASMTRYAADYEKAAADVKDGSTEITKGMQDAQDKMSKARLEVERLTEQYKKLYLETAQKNSGIYQLGDTLEKSGDKMIKAGKAMGDFADKWTKVGVAIGGVTGIVLKQFIDWESSVASMEKTIDNTDGTVDRLAESFREMSKVIPVSASELNELAGIAGQLGIESGAIEGFTRVIADLGVTTDVSAEDAGIALAQFANITKMSQEDFDRLGSSIVNLGNNFATQESSIISMAQRLAGAGAQVNMTEAEIMAVSTALSALGVRAEQGGSAFSKVMINMSVAAETGLDAVRELEQASGYTSRELELMASNSTKDFKDLADSLGMTTAEINSIVKAGNDLEGFAQIAGMTGEQFKKTFQEDAIGAIAAFIDGLATAQDEGSSAIELLDEMGIKEVRLRDTLLRLGGAQGLFNEALAVSNQGWDENTALQDEANLRYETSASKIKMAKNEIQDMAIEMGAQLMPAIADLFKQGRPIIDMLTGWIESFANTSDETKELTVKLLGIAIAGGPVLKAFANITTGVGHLGKGIGGTIKTLFDFATEAKGVEAIAGTLGTKAIPTLASSLLPLAPAIVGITAAVGLGYGAWKLWGEEAYNASERTKQWGSDIGEEADKALTIFRDLTVDISDANLEMQSNVESGANKAIEAYSAMGEEIRTSVTADIEETKRVLSTMPESVQDSLRSTVDRNAQEQRRLLAETETIQAEITGIYENALAANREITDDEMTIIEGYHTRMAEIRAETLGLSAEEQANVLAVMAGDLEKFSKKQLRDREDYLNEQNDLEKESYAERIELLDNMLAEGDITYEKYTSNMEDLALDHNEKMLGISAELVKVWEAMGMSEGEINAMLRNYGFTTDEIEAYLERQAEAAKKTSSVLIETSEDAYESTKQANDAWNLLVLDDKTGEVHTNLEEFLAESSQSEEGWNNLKFIMQNAELETNTKAVIKEALIESGRWNDLTLEEKMAFMDTNAYETMIEYVRASDVWDKLSPKELDYLTNTNSPETAEKFLRDKGLWDKLDPMMKKFLTDTNSWDTYNEAKKGVYNFNDLKPKQLKLDATTNAWEVAASAQRAVNSVTGKTVNIDTIHRSFMDTSINSGAYATRSAAGANYHPGGLGILGDGGQHEPWLQPDGTFGISPKEDTLYDFQRGTKVWRSIDALLQDLPMYAKGTRNEPIQYGDKVFNQLTDALVPFSRSEVPRIVSTPVSNNSPAKVTLEVYPIVELNGKQISKEIAEPLSIELDNLDLRKSIIKYGRRK